MFAQDISLVQVEPVPVAVHHSVQRSVVVEYLPPRGCDRAQEGEHEGVALRLGLLVAEDPHLKKERKEHKKNGNVKNWWTKVFSILTFLPGSFVTGLRTEVDVT